MITLTGHQGIDSDHQDLSLQLTNLIRCTEIGDDYDYDIIIAHFKNLGDEIARHFGFENQLMTTYNYPKREQHFKEHDDKLMEYLELFISISKIGISKDAQKQHLQQLISWFLNHIIEEDVPLAQYLQNGL